MGEFGTHEPSQVGFEVPYYLKKWSSSIHEESEVQSAADQSHTPWTSSSESPQSTRAPLSIALAHAYDCRERCYSSNPVFTTSSSSIIDKNPFGSVDVLQLYGQQVSSFHNSLSP